jgi:cyclophilin family peptidyl-prolyl cis-trans isomerase/HEAT repeat protein
MMRARAAAALLVAVLAAAYGPAGSAAAQRSGRAGQPPAMSPALAQQAILAAEDGRIALPDGLHTPAIDVLRAKLAEDLRILFGLTTSTDSQTQVRAIRALSRYERREVITDLLRFLPTLQTRSETANALAQALRGEPVPDDTDGQQVQAVFEALVQVGEIDDGSAVGAITRSIGRLPYVRPDQVRAADAFLVAMMRKFDPDPNLRPALMPAMTRGFESLVRIHGKRAGLSEDAIDWLRRIVTGIRRSYPAAARVNAMAALVTALGVDEETLRAAAAATVPELQRLAAMSLGGAGSPVVPAERTDLLTTLLADPSAIVRVEAVRAWARQEAPTTGCQRLLDALKDKSRAVVLAAVDALGDHCRDDLNVTDRLTVEARTPPPNDWWRESHALVALAKRAPGRVFIPLLGSHVQHVTWQVRMYAARAAAITNEVSALERLALDGNDNVREAALAPLKRLKGDEAEPYFIAALARNDYQLLRTAAIELNGVKPTPALGAALVDAVRRVSAGKKETSRDTRLALLQRLGEIGNPDQVGSLVPLLQDYDLPVAQRAAAVLQQWTGKLFEIAPQPLPRPALPLAIELQEVADADVPARIKMRSGKTIRINLLPDVAPLTSVRFLRLVKSGYYNGLTFHRVVPNFVIQGGSPGANEYAGDALYVRDEVGLAAHTRGAVGLSTRGRDTGDAQFFINLVDNPRLDFEYTVFGYVKAEDMDGVDEIAEGDAIDTIKFDKTTTEEKAPLLRPVVDRRP